MTVKFIEPMILDNLGLLKVSLCYCESRYGTWYLINFFPISLTLFSRLLNLIERFVLSQACYQSKSKAKICRKKCSLVLGF
jgi:hypothetical protein